MANQTIQPTAAGDAGINTTPNAPAAVSIGDEGYPTATSAGPLLHPAKDSVPTPPQPTGSNQTIQGLPAGFTVDSQAPSSASQVHGLPAGFTVDSAPPSPDAPSEPAVDLSPITGFGKGIIETGQGLQHVAGLDNTFWGAGPKVDTTAHGAGESVGKAGEALAEFLTGDEALKALPVAERLLTSGKILKTLENSPRLMQAIKIGMGAMRAGVVGGSQEYAKTGGDSEAALKAGTGAAIGAGALGAAGEIIGGSAGDTVASNVRNVAKAAGDDLGETAQAVKTVPRKVYPAATPEQPIYDTLHEQVRGAVAAAAKQAGVAVKDTDSIQDVASSAAKAFKAEASKVYGQIDDALTAMSDDGGDMRGRYQAVDENITKLKKKVSDLIGEPEKQQQVQEALDAENAKKQAITQKLKEAGLDDLPEKASSLHRQGSALEEFGQSVQKNTSGLPGHPDVPERLNPKTFANSLKNLKNSTDFGGNRLRQALGDSADTLIKQTNDAKAALQNAAEAAAQRALVKGYAIKSAIGGGVSTLLGGLGYEAVHKATE